jgi:hypothetical protein
MQQPTLPTDAPLRLRKEHLDDLANKLNQWLKSIDHADARTGNVQLHPDSVKALKKRIEPILRKIQFIRVESLAGSYPHF